MTYFAAELKRKMQERQMTGVDLGNRIGRSKAYVSKLLLGKVAVRDSDFIRICEAVSACVIDKAELVAARARDNVVGPVSDMIVIEVRKTNGKPEVIQDHTPYRAGTAIDPQFEQAISYLRKISAKDKDTAAWFVHQMRLMGLEKGPRQSS